MDFIIEKKNEIIGDNDYFPFLDDNDNNFSSTNGSKNEQLESNNPNLIKQQQTKSNLKQYRIYNMKDLSKEQKIKLKKILEYCHENGNFRSSDDFSPNNFKKFYPINDPYFFIPNNDIFNNQLKIYKCKNINSIKVYQGDINKKGQRHGIGKLTTPNYILIGMWKDDKFSGWGRESCSNGDVFEGRFENGVINGKGIFLDSIKNKYIGDFKEMKRWGKGKLVTKEIFYEGEFLENKLNGKGSIKFLKNELEYTGTFRNDQIEGKGIFKWKNGDKYEGEVKNGKMHGIGIFKCYNGQIYKGAFENGQIKDKKFKMNISNNYQPNRTKSLIIFNNRKPYKTREIKSYNYKRSNFVRHESLNNINNDIKLANNTFDGRKNELEMHKNISNDLISEIKLALKTFDEKNDNKAILKSNFIGDMDNQNNEIYNKLYKRETKKEKEKVKEILYSKTQQNYLKISKIPQIENVPKINGQDYMNGKTQYGINPYNFKNLSKTNKNNIIKINPPNLNYYFGRNYDIIEKSKNNYQTVQNKYKYGNMYSNENILTLINELVENKSPIYKKNNYYGLKNLSRTVNYNKNNYILNNLPSTNVLKNYDIYYGTKNKNLELEQTTEIPESKLLSTYRNFGFGDDFY